MKKAMTDAAHARLRARRDRAALEERARAYVDDARNMFGPLDAKCRKRLEAVIAKPNQRTWNNAYSLIVGKDGFTTLWQAWIKVDPDAPRLKPLEGPWPRVPDQLTIYRALREVTQGDES